MGDAEGCRVIAFRRIGKRIAIGFDNGQWWVIHLMVAGRLHWYDGAARNPTRATLATFEFGNGTLSLTEAGKKRRASMHVVSDESGLGELNPGGLELGEIDVDRFAAAITASNHTLKRVLTDPRILSGIGNAYSDEILHRARLSPVKLSQSLNDEETRRLFDATQIVMTEWTEQLRADADDCFPEKVTAFRPGMAVHGRYGEPCPDCGTAVQRIRYASNETNYCPRCQTGGKLLADRALSRLLKKDWPRSIEALEERQAGKGKDL